MNSKVISKLENLASKLRRVEKIEQHLDKLVNKEDQDLQKIKKQEQQINQKLITLGNFTVKKSHLMELARGLAGAFLGVGLGQALGGSVELAKILPWINTIGILVFIFVIVGFLIYKNDREEIEESGGNIYTYVSKELVYLYSISLIVQLLGLILFNNFPGWNETLIKALIIGSYTAMSSAAAFTLI